MRLALAALLLALVTATGAAAAAVTRVVPATGSYAARGSGDPADYDLSATVQRKGGRAYVSVRVRDRCGGFATFPEVRVGRSRRGVPIFAAEVGGAHVGGHWDGSERIDGSVKTPCAGAQRYELRRAR